MRGWELIGLSVDNQDDDCESMDGVLAVRGRSRWQAVSRGIVLALALSSALIMLGWATLALRGSRQTLSGEVLLSAGPKGTLPLVVQECATDGGCTDKQMFLTLDQNWRFFYNKKTWKKCTGCEGAACDECALDDKIDYRKYGVTSSPDMKTVTLTSGIRLYLLDSTGANYTMLSLVGKEISWDVDMSKLPCGMNSAMYTVEMPADGGQGPGKAVSGGGYCDAQCPVVGITSAKEAACCMEFDLWEGNRAAQAITLHPCQHKDGSAIEGVFNCSGTPECKSKQLSGVCDGYGCDFNPYRNGKTTFYGNSTAHSVDTTQRFTVTVQLVANAAGELVEVKRFYTQNGQHIQEPTIEIAGQEFNSLTDAYCEAALTAHKNSTSDPNSDKCNSPPVGPDIFTSKGGVKTQGESLARGNVLVISLWNDGVCNMLWLDGTHGAGDGGERGPCGGSDESGPFGKAGSDIGVIYSNLKYGDLGSTVSR